jgi:hypothetical protein
MEKLAFSRRILQLILGLSKKLKIHVIINVLLIKSFKLTLSKLIIIKATTQMVKKTQKKIMGDTGTVASALD